MYRKSAKPTKKYKYKINFVALVARTLFFLLVYGLEFASYGLTYWLWHEPVSTFRHGVSDRVGFMLLTMIVGGGYGAFENKV